LETLPRDQIDRALGKRGEIQEDHENRRTNSPKPAFPQESTMRFGTCGLPTLGEETRQTNAASKTAKRSPVEIY